MSDASMLEAKGMYTVYREVERIVGNTTNPLDRDLPWIGKDRLSVVARTLNVNA